MPIIKKGEVIDIEYIIQLSHNKFFDDFTPNTIPSKRFEAIKISTDKLSIKLIDKNQQDLLSVIHGNFKLYHDIEYFEIKGTYSKLQKHGFLTYLFQILVYELGYKILSDSQHSSPGSKEFWQALIRKYNFSIYRIDIKTNYKRRASRFKENEIWYEATNNNFNTFLDNFEYYIEDNTFIENDIEDSYETDDQLDEITEILPTEIETTSFSMENIRLIAEKIS